MACAALNMDVTEIVDLVSSDEEVKEEYLSPPQAKWYTYVPNSIVALSSRLLKEDLSPVNGRKRSIRPNEGAGDVGEEESEKSSQGSIQVIDLTLPPPKLEGLIESDWITEALDPTLAPNNSSSPGENRIDNDVEMENDFACDQTSPLGEGSSSQSTSNSSSDTSPEASKVQSSTTPGRSKTTDSNRNCSETSALDHTSSLSKTLSEVQSTLGSVSQLASLNNISYNRIVTLSRIKQFTEVYPCLCVRVRPFLRPKARNDDSPLVKSQRLVLDKMVKELIQKNPAQLIEWCIVQGLINPTQTCDLCRDDDGEPVVMNLIQYSNSSAHTMTGGYTWECSQCKTCTKSVFSGSIFKGSYPLVTYIKLIYHWVTSTDTSYIVEWVSVEPGFIKYFFSLLRAVCTSAIRELQGKLGGSSKIVQVGVVSMKPAGVNNKRPLTFLGALDERCLLQLQLVENVQNGEKCGPEKMARILKPIEEWVDKNSIICTDFSINKKYLQKLGFSEVHQVETSTPDDSVPLKYSNAEIKNYLKFQIPNMLKDSIFKLPRAVIQQFLNELTWRERWEHSPLETFSKILDHITLQTKACQGDSLVNKLLKINEDPFRNGSEGCGKTDEIIVLTS